VRKSFETVIEPNPRITSVARGADIARNEGCDVVIALVDPELILTVPKDQAAYGVCDIITHVTEGYFSGIDGTPIQEELEGSSAAWFGQW
jgi:alcohol dehydrogenase YqhD (iron-dependent ADH family)